MDRWHLQYSWGREESQPGGCSCQPHLLTPAVPPVQPAVAVPGVTQPVAGGELLAQASSVPPLGAHQSHQVQPPQVHLQVLLLLWKDRPCRAPCPVPVAALQPGRGQEVTGTSGQPLSLVLKAPHDGGWGFVGTGPPRGLGAWAEDLEGQVEAPGAPSRAAPQVCQLPAVASSGGV